MTPSLTAGTRLAGVIGSPIRHSLSPVIHNAAFAALGLDWVFLAFEVLEREVPRVLDAVRALGIEGLSVTMPDKAAVAAAVDVLTPAAQALGAANCVSRDADQLVGSNTDGAGFVDSLRADLGIDPTGLAIAVLGAGGAARAVVRALGEAGASEIVVVGRTPSRVDRAAALADGIARAADSAEVRGCAVVVNATPVGMGRTAGELPLDADLLGAEQTIVDLVYDPVETALMAAARAKGARAANGVGMLVHQAGHQLRRWTGHEPPLGAMQLAIERALTSS